mmetsp:Transcript_22360/g.36989  ORF Transcript_22360/g.36989 Transcript_22360/m.36989 type:complete len:99 (+) Transcript_22360:616-912(+)
MTRAVFKQKTSGWLLLLSRIFKRNNIKGELCLDISLMFGQRRKPPPEALPPAARCRSTHLLRCSTASPARPSASYTSARQTCAWHCEGMSFSFSAHLR